MRMLKWLLLIGCVINCILFDIWFYLYRNTNPQNSPAGDDVLGVLEIIIIFVNFLFVVWMYFRDEKKEERRRYQEKENYWYHNILIQDNIKIVQELFSTCISLSQKADIKKIKSLLRIIKDKKNNVENVFGYMLKAYNEKLYNQFNDELIKFEDEITNSFTKLLMKDITKEDYINDVRKCEVALISILMKHDLKINNA